MALSPRRLVGLICVCLAVLIACILIGLSVSIVPWNHLALVEDDLAPGIWDEVYGSGRLFIGVGRRFHAFPMDYRLVDFSWLTVASSYGDSFYDAPSLVGRTADGLGVTMAVTVFARLRRDKLRDMYLSYCYSDSHAGGGGSEFTCADRMLGLVALYARDALLDLVAETRTEDFFRDRLRISEAMAEAVRAAVAPLHIEVPKLNLRQVVFDPQVGHSQYSRTAHFAIRERSSAAGWCLFDPQAVATIPTWNSLTMASLWLYLSWLYLPWQVDEAITSKIVTAQSIETKLLGQQMRQVGPFLLAHSRTRYGTHVLTDYLKP